MNPRTLAVVAAAAAAVAFLFWPRPPAAPTPAPGPTPPPPARTGGRVPGKPVEGTKASPDGAEEVTCDLPESLREPNVGGSDGAGLCVFTSIEYAAKFQNVRQAMDLQEHMRREPGGGYPEKVDAMLKKYAPGAAYMQDTTGDPAVLKAILASGRLACLTYSGHDPHYGNQTIYHMVCCPCFGGWAAIYDNNFTRDDQVIWMSEPELVKRWKDAGGGWVFCWLNPPPPPVPHN